MLAALDEVLDPAAARPKLRTDAQIADRTTRWGERDAVVHAPGTPYLRLHGEEVDIVRRLDGSATVATLVSESLNDGELRLDDVVGLIADLEQGGLTSKQPVDVYAAVEQRMRSRVARMRHRVLRAMKEQSVDWRGADHVFGALYRRVGRFVFTPVVLSASALVIVGGFIAAVANGAVSGSVSGGQALTLFAMVLVALFFHETGHAFAVKRAGRSVVTAGFRLYLGHPAFFIDSTDLVFATKRQRAVNAVAGPWVEATLAGAAGIAAWVAPNGSFAPILDRFAVITFLNVALNLIPFVELDGYWLLSDVLEIPQLRAKALAVLRQDVPTRLRRRRDAFTAAERSLLAFALAGVVVSAVAIVLAFTWWLPVARSLVTAGWRAGTAGRIAVVLLAAVVVGPVAEVTLAIARATARRIGATVEAIRFWAQTRWRVEAAELVSQLPGLESLDEDDLSDLAGRVYKRRVRAGATVVRQGDTAAEFFVVRTGDFDVVEVDHEGTERVLHVMRRGDSFGELALLSHRPRSASVVAAIDGELFGVDAGTFERLLAPSLTARELAPAVGPALEMRQLPLFKGLSLGEASELAASAQRCEFAAGEVAVQQGDAADSFFVITAGQARVERDGTVVATLRNGDHFGETGLLDRVPRTATVVATTPMQAVRFDADTFNRLVAAAFGHHRATTHTRALGGEFA